MGSLVKNWKNLWRDYQEIMVQVGYKLCICLEVELDKIDWKRDEIGIAFDDIGGQNIDDAERFLKHILQCTCIGVSSGPIENLCEMNFSCLRFLIKIIPDESVGIRILAIQALIIPCIYASSWLHLTEIKSTRSLMKLNRDLHRWSTGILLVCADNATTWNHRKVNLQNEIRENSVHDQIVKFHKELSYCHLILRRFPKCGEAWSYCWFLVNCIDELCERKSVLVEELSFCLEMANRAKNNYYAWTYRIRILTKYVSDSSGYESIAFLKSELELNSNWIRQHVLDSSAFNYRRLLLENLFSIDYESRVSEMLEKENAFILNLTETLNGKISQCAETHRVALEQLTTKF